MRPRDDPAEPGRGPTGRRRRSGARERPRSRRGTERQLRGCRHRTGASPALVPGATLVALVAVAILAAARAASGLLREWCLAIAASLAVAGCWLGALVVAHLAARLAAARIGTGR